MAKAVSHVLDHLLAGATQAEQTSRQIPVGDLVPGSDIVDLPHGPASQHKVDGGAVVRDVQPIADLRPVAEYEQARVEVQKQIDKGRQEAQALIAQALQTGEKLKEESRQEAAKQAQVILDRTRAELESDRDKIIENLRKEFVDIAISAAGKVIKETLDKEKHRKLIEETLQQSAVLKKS